MSIAWRWMFCYFVLCPATGTTSTPHLHDTYTKRYSNVTVTKDPVREPFTPGRNSHNSSVGPKLRDTLTCLVSTICNMTDLDTLANDATTAFDLSSSTKKRARPEVVNDEERKRLRDKNRTNSKRFRDRKKDFMDSLFEEKYRLGKTNNELREENERLRSRFEEALAENEMHRRNATLGAYQVDAIVPTAPSPMLLNARALSHTSLGLHRPLTVSQPLALTSNLLNPRSNSPDILGLLGEVEMQKRKRIMDDLALRDLEDTIKAKIATSRSDYQLLFGNKPCV